MATLTSLLPISMMLQCYAPPDTATPNINHPSPHNITTHPIGKPTGPWTPSKSWITQNPFDHPIATSSLFTHQSTNQSCPPHPPTMPAADICCLHPPTRSLSPNLEPARPSHTPLLSLDGIFAVAALPNDHPHSIKIPVQDRRPPKNLIRSPSLVGKLRGQLRRRATVRSLRAGVWDGDARVLTAEEAVRTPLTVMEREG